MAQPALAGGRSLPELVFVTNADAMSQFGMSEQSLRNILGEQHLHMLPNGVSTARLAANHLWSTLAHGRSRTVPRGVVLLGGYDTVPSRTIRAIDPIRLTGTQLVSDEDRFFAWNDDVYGDVDGDDLPELPVSRIPHGVNLEVALGADSHSSRGARSPAGGAYLGEFPFALDVFNECPNAVDSEMVRLTAISHPELTSAQLRADRLLFALHADQDDFSSYRTSEGDAVMRASLVPPSHGSVVVSACCWGALTVRESPILGGSTPASALRPILANDSIALTFLDQGALAYVGFTARSWMPQGNPFEYFAVPLFRSVWRNVTSGQMAPALALFTAKASFIAGFPYDNPKIAAGTMSSNRSKAVHLKAYWSMTCLGLGW